MYKAVNDPNIFRICSDYWYFSHCQFAFIFPLPPALSLSLVLVKGLSILLIVSKNQHKVHLLYFSLLIFCFCFIDFYFDFYYFLLFAYFGFLLSLASWGGSWHWLKIFLLSKYEIWWQKFPSTVLALTHTFNMLCFYLV